ncbi:MAG TPA: penicillin-binding transpeptidase domain-containing protein [Pyrinomonadaceae bacterium]|nr:penicillin-binding transpeptidase domain-containing protein [Pyrinomonadaceae bacterium]
MTLISSIVRIALLGPVLVFLVASPSVLKASTGKNRPAKQAQAKRTLPSAEGKKVSALRKTGVSARETGLEKRRQISEVKLSPVNGSTKSSKIARRRLEQQRLEAKRRAEAERAAYVRAIERTRDEQLRNQVQALIAKDDLTGEDSEVRRIAVAALGNHAGTVVVMNPQTGRVYSMVNQQWALREGFKPCSTIKLVTGLAGLNENLIGLDETANISTNNQVGLTRALAYSKNGYFQQVGGQVGFDKMLSYARRLGLGEKTGINVHNESQGSVPSRSAQARMWSHGDDFQVTPIQLATLVSAMANGGKLLTPRVTRTKQEELNFKTRVRRQIKMETDSWRQMIPGMVGAVSYGSGRRAYDPRETVAGKTGTCIEEGNWVGLFTSYAPLANPQLAVVVIARGADAHNHLPAAVAGRIYRDLNGRFGTPANLQLATTRRSTAGKPLGSDEDEDEEDGSTAVSKTWSEANNIGGISRTRDAQPLARTSSQPTDTKVKPVLMQIPSRKPEAVKPLVTPAGKPSNNLLPDTRPRRVFGE